MVFAGEMMAAATFKKKLIFINNRGFVICLGISMV